MKEFHSYYKNIILRFIDVLWASLPIIKVVNYIIPMYNWVHNVNNDYFPSSRHTPKHNQIKIKPLEFNGHNGNE